MAPMLQGNSGTPIGTNNIQQNISGPQFIAAYSNTVTPQYLSSFDHHNTFVPNTGPSLTSYQFEKSRAPQENVLIKTDLNVFAKEFVPKPKVSHQGGTDAWDEHTVAQSSAQTVSSSEYSTNIPNVPQSCDYDYKSNRRYTDNYSNHISTQFHSKRNQGREYDHKQDDKYYFDERRNYKKERNRDNIPRRNTHDTLQQEWDHSRDGHKNVYINRRNTRQNEDTENSQMKHKFSQGNLNGHTNFPAEPSSNNFHENQHNTKDRWYSNYKSREKNENSKKFEDERMKKTWHTSENEKVNTHWRNNENNAKMYTMESQQTQEETPNSSLKEKQYNTDDRQHSKYKSREKNEIRNRKYNEDKRITKTWHSTKNEVEIINGKVNTFQKNNENIQINTMEIQQSQKRPNMSYTTEKHRERIKNSKGGQYAEQKLGTDEKNNIRGKTSEANDTKIVDEGSHQTEKRMNGNRNVSYASNRNTGKTEIAERTNGDQEIGNMRHDPGEKPTDSIGDAYDERKQNRDHIYHCNQNKFDKQKNCNQREFKNEHTDDKNRLSGRFSKRFAENNANITDNYDSKMQKYKENKPEMKNSKDKQKFWQEDDKRKTSTEVQKKDKETAWDEEEFKKQKELFKEKPKYRDLKLERETKPPRSSLSYEEKYSRAFLDKEDQNIEDLFDKNYEDEEYQQFLKELNHKFEPARIREQEQDLFEVDPTFSLAHCVAEDFRMGSGIALDFRNRFKRVDELLMQRQTPGGLGILKYQNTPTGKVRYVYYLVTKRRSRDKPTYKDFWRSTKTLRDHIRDNNVQQLAIPKVGCGLDKLDWSTVKHIIEFLFRNVQVDILYCRYSEAVQNEDSFQRSNQTVDIQYCSDKLLEVEERTLILYFATADNRVTDVMEELDTKFKFLEDFKAAPKKFGTVVNHKTDDHLLCGCVVSRNRQEMFNFTSFKKCLLEINEYVSSGDYTGIAMPYVSDDRDPLLYHKVVTMLINYLDNISVYVYSQESVDET